MIHVLHVIDLYIMLRCDIVLLGTNMGAIDMGTIGIILYQHFVIARTSYVIDMKHNKCLFWDDIIPCNCYSHMMLSFYDSCSTCYRSMLNATMRYCIVWGPSIWESLRWGPSYENHWYGDHRYTSISIWGGIACLGVGGVDMYQAGRGGVALLWYISA